jgi:ElaB/YqjD/DUF883 family membrane-anchored ribosome-binding protein
MVDQATQQDMSAATEKMKEGAYEFKEAVSGQAAETYEEYKERGAEMIRTNPYTSLLVAFGIGTLIGMFLLRKSE